VVQPDPFNPATLEFYEIMEKGKVSLQVYDAAGRCVRVLVDEDLDAGKLSQHVAAFDGRTDYRRDAASGTYFLRLSAGGETAVRKLNLVR